MRNPPKKADGSPLTPAPIQPDLTRVRRADEDVKLETEVRQYRLITPLFGGGVAPGEADPVTVIRGSSIRGQLRFWWRACRGGNSEGSLQKMKEEEDRIWGAATSTEKSPRPSQVQIVVEVNRSGNSAVPFRMMEGRPDRFGNVQARSRPCEDIAPAYGAFPLQPTEADQRRYRMDTPIKPLRKNVEFALTITYPVSEKAEVQAALWAWETFGGIGGRTRRGFGALGRTEKDAQKPPRSTKEIVEEHILTGLQEHVVDTPWPRHVPHLKRTAEFAITNSVPTAQDAWKYLLQRLKEFRQQRRPGTEPNRPGRSLWPEPDEIRRLTGQSIARHRTPVSSIRKFPRSAFGLPIIFQFKDTNKRNPQDSDYDPVATTLQGANHERLASPLLLRPLECGDGRSVGLAVLLEAPIVPPGGLVLKQKDEPDRVAKGTLIVTEAASLSMLSGAAATTPFDGEKVVLKAFLMYL